MPTGGDRPADHSRCPNLGGNGDGILQFNELGIVADLIVLSTPEIAGLPYTVAALVAAGGLAAALSTADGLLLVIATAISHDIYSKLINPQASYGATLPAQPRHDPGRGARRRRWRQFHAWR